MTQAATNRAYWEKRFLQVKAREIRGTEAYEKALQPQLNAMYRELQSETEKFLVRYANNEGIPKEEARKALAGIQTKHWENTLEQFEDKARKGGFESELDSEYYRSRIARIQELQVQLQQQTASFANEQTPKMQTALADQYQDTYMHQNFNIQVLKGHFTANFAKYDSQLLKMVVSQPWGNDGKDFSQRLWKNYRKELPSLLVNTLAKGTLLGYSPARITSQMHAQFQDVKRNQIHRLVVSEMGHVAEEATAAAYEENKIEKYEYLATLESHTCAICGHLDGEIISVKDRKPGVNYPLIHARCRCTTMPWMADLPDIGERWARDPETGKGTRIDNVKYPDWLEMVRTQATNSIIGVQVKGVDLNVSGISQHILQRINERDLNPQELQDALEQPIYIKDVKYEENGPSQKYVGKKVTVAINPDTGNLITAFRTSSRIRRKWERENENS